MLQTERKHGPPEREKSWGSWEASDPGDGKLSGRQAKTAVVGTKAFCQRKRKNVRPAW